MANKRNRDDRVPKRQGDILGISDATGEIPQATDDKGGHPEGIEVGRDRPGSRDVQRGPGATSIDMGSGGEGHAIKP